MLARVRSRLGWKYRCALGVRGRLGIKKPRGSIYTTIMELGPIRPSPLWFWGPNSIIVVYMDPLGKKKQKKHPENSGGVGLGVSESTR